MISKLLFRKTTIPRSDENVLVKKRKDRCSYHLWVYLYALLSEEHVI